MTTLLSATATARAIDTTVSLRRTAASLLADAATLDSIGMWRAADTARADADRFNREADRVAADLLLLVTR